MDAARLLGETGSDVLGAVQELGHRLDEALDGAAVQRLVEAVAELLKNTQDVGNRFAEEARRIHYGESDAKAIRGQTTPEEREALADEGIEVFTLPGGLPPKTPLQ